MPGEEFYLKSYWVLSTERTSSMQSVGRIPWSKAMEFARHKHLTPDTAELFWSVISGMDDAYLQWMRGEHDRYQRLNKPKGKTGKRQTARGGRNYKR